MRKSSNKKFISNILIISSMSILIVYLFVEFKLSQNELALFIVGFNTMLLSGFMVLIFIVFLIIFIVRLVLKKKKCFVRSLSIIGAITITTILSTAIMVKEHNRYYHIINSNWKINLPREYDEIYHTNSGASFHGDGERYSIFQYENLDEINSLLEWENKNDYVEFRIKEILDNLEIPKEYSPDFNNDFRYYYEMREDRSEIYIILDSDLKGIYIIENFL